MKRVAYLHSWPEVGLAQNSLETARFPLSFLGFKAKLGHVVPGMSSPALRGLSKVESEDWLVPAGALAASPVLPGEGRKGPAAKAGVPHLTLWLPWPYEDMVAGLAFPGWILALVRWMQGHGFRCILPEQRVLCLHWFWEGLYPWVSPGATTPGAMASSFRHLNTVATSLGAQ